VKLIVGLGNPGPRYRESRHSVGFRVVDRLASRLKIPLTQARFEGHFGSGGVQGIEVGLLEPQTFMNDSGSAVVAALAGLPVEDASRDLLVVYDDADLPLGRLRLRAQGGDGGHLGLRDVIASVGTREIPRLRFGIGRPPPSQDTVTHVLEGFSDSENRLLDPALDRASAAAEVFLRDGIVAAMDRFNAVAPAEDSGPEEGSGS
jgi:PTH1 family peptidyl-tRNA hydrolase